MKHSIILLLSLLLTIGSATARSKGPRHDRHEKRLAPVEQAAKLSSAMKLSDDVSSKFVTVYIEYCSALDKVFKEHPLIDKPTTDDEYHKNNDIRFDVARAILSVREKYYKKFSKILTAKQIDTLYRCEKRFRRPPMMPPVAINTLDDATIRELRQLSRSLRGLQDSLRNLKLPHNLSEIYINGYRIIS